MHYATRSCILYFDRPAILQAKIPSSSLGFASLNSSEAILNIEYLNDLNSIQCIDVSKEHLHLAVKQNLPVHIEYDLKKAGEDFTADEQKALRQHFEELKVEIFKPS